LNTRFAFLLRFAFLILSSGFPSAAGAQEESIVIYRSPYNESMLVVVPSGERIFINVGVKSFLPPDLSSRDVLVVTHDTWWDVYNPEIIAAFPGRKLIAEKGVIELKGARITTIPAYYQDNTHISDKGGYFAILIEAAGLRFLHMGEAGQSAPTASQAPYFMQPDILYGTLYVNSDDHAVNSARMRFIPAVRPRLVIPAGHNDISLKKVLKDYRGMYNPAPDARLILNAKNLPSREKPGLIVLESLPPVLEHYIRTYGLVPYRSLK
jgi:hypothetical protein